MSDLTLPDTMIDARRTPLFDADTVPEPLTRVHRATVLATLHVQEGPCPHPTSATLAPASSLVTTPSSDGSHDGTRLAA